MTKLRFDKKILIRILFYIFASIVVGYTHINHLEFLLLTICLFSIFAIARFSYFTIFSFILWFSFFQEYIATINPSLAAGRLMAGLNVPVYDLELFVCTMFFFIFELIVFSTTDVIESEKEIYKRKIVLSKKVGYVLSTIGFGLILLAYPSLPSFNGLLGRDQGILPSSLVVNLAMLLCAVLFDNLQKSKFLKYMTILTLLWIFFHGDRVIVMGYLIYAGLKYINDGNFNFNTLKAIVFNRRMWLVVFAITIVAVLAIRVQTTRQGTSYSMSLDELLMAIIKQGTAGDVVFSFNCSVDMWKSGDCLGVNPYLYYASNVLPSADNTYYTAMILLSRYNTMGGGLFFTEPMISGGMLMTFIHSAVFIFLITWVFKKNTKYHSFLIIPFCLLIFRIEWYASCAGLVKMFLYYVPATYYFTRKFK